MRRRHLPGRFSPVLTALAASAVFLTLAACAANPRPVPETDDPHLATAYRVLSTTPLVDGHNDLPWRIRRQAGHDVLAYDLKGRTEGHTDIPRLREGMVGAQFWSVYVPPSAMEAGTAARVQLEEIDIAHRIIDAHPETFELATSPADVRRIFSDGKIASMLGMEGGHAIENSLGALRSFHRLGVRYMTLTHSANIDWADSCCEDPEIGGLSDFGREVVREMNRLGMLVDISHVSPATMHDVLDVSRAPVIFSHSSALARTDHPRNVPDTVLRRMSENGGVVMVTFVTAFVSQELLDWYERPEEERGERPEVIMAHVVDHIEHVRDVAGIDHVGIGSDYDGATVPSGLEDVSTFPALFAELSRRGWTEAELRKLAGENVLRAWADADSVARRLRAQRPPSVATIDELDGMISAGTGAFVTRLGHDTLAVERFAFTPTSFQVTAVVRVPRTQFVRYRGELDRSGNLESLLVLQYDPANPPPSGAEPTGGARFRYGPDTVTVEGRSDDAEFSFDVAADSTAIPFFETVHWPFELALMRRAAGAGGDTVPMITGRRAMPFVLTDLGEDRVQIRHPYRGTMEVAVTGEGRIRTLDASGTTRKLFVERVDEVDIAALAREFARRDEAGEGIGRLSGRAEATGEIDDVGVVVDYGVPRKRGREIFDELVPFGEVWRTGANRATHLTTHGDLIVGETVLPEGTYTVFTIPGPEEWTLIINRATDINGTAYDPAEDFARIPMDVRTLDRTVEAFSISVDPEGYLRLRWDRTEAVVPVRAP